MDHLPAVKHPYCPLQIPYVPYEDYDSGGFDDFPNRRGWTPERLERSRGDESLRQDAVPFLQTWLYFGTMSEVMGIPIQKVDFIRSGDDGTWITTDQLPSYLQRWKDDIALSSLPDEQHRYQNSVNCLRAAGNKFNDLAEILAPEHQLSIAALLFMLNYALDEVYQGAYPRVEGATYLISTDSIMQLLRSRFTGSCPSLFDRLSKRLTFQALYYASLLSPPPTEDHRQCSEVHCILERLDVKTYSTAHFQDDCNCGHVLIDQIDLFICIVHGVVPLVSLDDDGADLKVRVVPFVDGEVTPYTAISHAWSHGLGNPGANSLPECQLRSLDRRVREADPGGRGYFWMDTLCVPRESKEARRDAIGKMKDIYGWAKMVLVLDAELLRSTKECGLEEILMRITCSRWFTRLWTFQEAVLASRLVFQFLESSVDMQSLMEGYIDRISGARTAEHGVLTEGISFWISFREIHSPNILHHIKFAHVCRDVGWRSTSWIEDEPICLASVLGLDTRKILEASDSDRMQVFWSLQKEIPSAILFEPGQRLQNEGFRWAHSSLLNIRLDNNYNLSIDKRVAHVGAQGLLVDAFGFSLNLSAEVTSHPIYFKEKIEDTWYIVKLADDMSLEEWNNINVPKLGSPVLILREKVDDRNQTDGVLACFERKESETLFVQYVCRISLFGEGSYYHSLSSFPMHGLQDGSFGEPTDPEQRWCIS